jgi:hypothetical protein
MPPGDTRLTDPQRSVSASPRASAHAPRRSGVVLARFGPPPSPVARWLVPLAPITLAVALLAWSAIGGIYAKLGHPGASLDDSFIHFQYARAIAEGHPFRFEAGEPMTMGATSALWPLLLAPFYALGCKGLLILWPAWVLSFVALGLLAHEAYALAKPLTGEAAAIGAGAMVLAFSPFAWCAGSGMEVVPFAWCLTRSVRRASEWVEAAERTRRREHELIALALAAPLFRPEGALASLVIAAALLLWPREPTRSMRAHGLLALVAAVTPQLLSRLVTGQFQSNTAEVKLIPGNPYYVGASLWTPLRDNVRTLASVLLNGEIWSAEFIPHGSMPFAFAALAAIVWCAHARGQALRFRAATVLLLALAIAVPCTYVSFLWNRLRYLWPFAPFWLVGLACFSRALGDGLSRIRPRWATATPIAAGAIVGLFASKLEGTLGDLATSASAIDRQQVTLGKWAKGALPAGARIGVNDTGAIAYFGDHPTFDVVGLTTQNEGRYWVAGAGSRFEHYERLAKTSFASLPQYFIVYPEWMAMQPVLGARLHDATVSDSTILGGPTMVAYEADYSLLGSGEQPWSARTSAAGRPLDVVDVADLESEREHAYALLGADDGLDFVNEGDSPEGKVVVDGGRRDRSRERFRVQLGAGSVAQGIARLESSEETRVRVLADGHEVASFPVDPGTWVEVPFALPHAGSSVLVELIPDAGTLTTYHYWFTSGASP